MSTSADIKKRRPTSVFRSVGKGGRQGGFTLLELALVALFVGLMTVFLAPSMGSLKQAREQAYVAEQTAINERIAQALLNHAEYGQLVPGTLIAPCTSSTNKVFYSIYNPTRCSDTSALLDYLRQAQVPLNKVNDDGTAAKNVRVYQRVASLSQQANLYYQGGPVTYLNYDYGVIYLTNCSFNAACNQTNASSTNPPRSSNPANPSDTAAYSGRLTYSNIGTWQPGTFDIAPVYFSTLPLQRKMLARTATNIDQLRTALMNFYETKRAANPSSTANHYPRPSNPIVQQPADPDPLTNQGCREGWYILDDALSDILLQIGIADSEFGRTAWGASIEYCRDYDPTGASGYGVAPHHAALRINRFVSLGMPADNERNGGDPNNNIVISF